jgi:hypothetical protein
MNPNDSLVKGEDLGGEFGYHLLNTTGPPMIHVTRSLRPEIVLFGYDQRFVTPLVIEAGKDILVNGDESGKVTVSKFAVGQPDQKRLVSDKVDEVIRAIVELGGTYPDVVLALQQAKASQSLTGRFEVDAIPDTGRTYRQKDASGNDEADESQSSDRIEVANPLPELFSGRKTRK